MYRNDKYEFKALTTNTGLEIKPMRYYPISTNRTFDEIKEGDCLVGWAETFDGKVLNLSIGNIQCIMPYESYGISGCTDQVKAIHSRFGRKVIFRVEGKLNNKLFVERKSIAQETADFLSQKMMDQNVDVTMENITSHSAFVDLGNGIQSFVAVQELSKTFIPVIKKEFRHGDRIRVKILGYNPITELFQVSRKLAYEPIDFPKGTPISVICRGALPESIEPAVFVEFDPNNIGIMNIPSYFDQRDFYYGRRIQVQIRSQKLKGFKATFLSF